MKEIAYKLLDDKSESYNGFQWRHGIWYETDGEGELCGPGWFHFCDDPMLTVFFAPMFGVQDRRVLWLFETDGKKMDDGKGMKHGRTRAKLGYKVPYENLTPEQMVRFAEIVLEECRMVVAGHALPSGTYPRTFLHEAEAHLRTSRSYLEQNNINLHDLIWSNTGHVIHYALCSVQYIVHDKIDLVSLMKKAIQEGGKKDEENK